MSTTSDPSVSNPVSSTAASSTPASASAPTGITSVATPRGKQTKVQLQTSLQALASGLQSTFQPTDTFVLRGVTLTRDDAIAQVNAYLALSEGTKTALAQYRTAVQSERAGLDDLTPLREGLRTALQARYGKDGLELTTFGFSPSRAPKRTVASKATAAAKNKATRKARNTMGPVARQTVKGNVVGLAMTPLVAGVPQPAATTTGPTGVTNGANGSATAPTVSNGIPVATGH